MGSVDIYMNVYRDTLGKIIEDFHAQISDTEINSDICDDETKDRTALLVAERKIALDIYNKYSAVRHPLTGKF